MNRDQKAGALIMVIAIALMAIAFALSQGWSNPEGSLYLFLIGYDDESLGPQYFLMKTGYVVSVLIIVLAYGAIRYLSLVPQIYRRGKAEKINSGGDKESEP